MMALAPEHVRFDQLPLADDEDRTEGLVFRYTAPALSRNGVTGRPSEATAELGSCAARRGRRGPRATRCDAGGSRSRRWRAGVRRSSSRDGAGPLVGILCGRSPAERYSTHRGYVSSLTAVGAVPVILAAGSDADHFALAAVVDRCVALVATGGGDVDTDLYADAAAGAPGLLMDVDPARDIAEIALVQYARAQGKRVLGVCRGAQLLAVMGGGTLIHDLPEKGIDGHWDEERQYEPVHASGPSPAPTRRGSWRTSSR